MNAKKTTQRQGFKTSEFIVYPAHGVGQIISIEEQEVAGARLEPVSYTHLDVYKRQPGDGLGRADPSPGRPPRGL